MKYLNIRNVLAAFGLLTMIGGVTMVGGITRSAKVAAQTVDPAPRIVTTDQNNSDGLGNTSRVGELIVLDGLFNGRTGTNGTGLGTSRVGELIVLDNLFNRDSATGDGIRGTSRVGELIVLDSLFGHRQAGE